MYLGEMSEKNEIKVSRAHVLTSRIQRDKLIFPFGRKGYFGEGEVPGINLVMKSNV